MILRPTTAARAAALLAVPALLLTACGSSSTSSSTSSAAASAADSASVAEQSPPATDSAAATGQAAGVDASSAPFATSDCASLNPPADADTAPTGGTTVDAVTVTENAQKIPQVTVAKGAAPATKLIVKDLVVGTGPEATPTSTVTANYCGVGLASRAIFDSSWARGGQPLSFGLNQVIPGWQQGMPGMKVGGKRLLIIPGELAYGANPPSADIQPNETLVFVVDLTAVS